MIIDLQRRLREIGRIRIGEQVPTSKGKTRPKKLETFRLTSRDQQVIRAAADQFGGQPRPWQSPDGQQWEVITEAAAVSVIVPPGDMAHSVWYEQWSAGGCQVRCDGRWDHIADKACHCDPEARECSIHTRLSVMLPDLPGMGVWRLDTQGYYAAVELNGIVDLCAAQAARGVMLPARLRLEQRSVKRMIDGRVTTLRFAVPVLDLDVHPMSLTAGTPTPGEIGGFAGELPGPVFTPVPETEAALRPSVRDQITSVNDPLTRESRQAAIPSTGMRPRTVDERNTHDGSGPGDTPDGDAEAATASGPMSPGPSTTAAGPVPQGPAAGAGDAGGGPAPPAGEPAGVRAETDDTQHARGTNARTVGAASARGAQPPSPPTDDTDAVGWKDIVVLAGQVFALDYEAAPRGHKTKTVDRLRHALTYACTYGATSSSKQLTAEQLFKVRDTLDAIDAGTVTYSYETGDNAGITFRSASGRESTVLWANLEPDPEEATA